MPPIHSVFLVALDLESGKQVISALVAFMVGFTGAHLIWRFAPGAVIAIMIAGLSWYDRRRGIDRGPMFAMSLLKLESVLIMSTAAIVVALGLVPLTRSTWTSWALHPIAGLLTLALFPWVSSHRTHLPHLQAVARFSLLASPVVALFVLMRLVAPEWLAPTEYWSGMIGVISILPLGVWTFARILPTAAIVHEVDNEHTNLVERIDQARTLAFYLPDPVNRRAREALSQANIAQNAALVGITKGHAMAARNALVHGRVEVEYVEKMLTERLPASAQERMRSSLEEGRKSLEELSADVRAAGLDETILDEIRAGLDEAETRIADVPTKLEEIRDWAKPMLETLVAITDLRTAVRFYGNSDESITEARLRLEDGQRTEKIGGKLGIDVTGASARRQSIEAMLTDFEQGKFTNYGALVASYVLITEAVSLYRRKVAEIVAAIEGGWIRVTRDTEVCLYVPATVRANKTTRTLVGVSPVFSGESIRTVIDGALLELPIDRESTIRSGEWWSVPIAAKRSGWSTWPTLILRWESDGQWKSTEIQIRGIGTPVEVVRNAIVGLPLIGAFVTTAVWLAGRPLDDATQVGVIVGSAIAVIYVIVALARMYGARDVSGQQDREEEEGTGKEPGRRNAL